MEEEQTIIEEWDRVKIPSPPEIQEITIKPRETALLVLDIQNQNCNEERRPRCVRTLFAIQMLIEKSRKSGMPVIFSLTSAASKADMRREILFWWCGARRTLIPSCWGPSPQAKRLRRPILSW